MRQSMNRRASITSVMAAVTALALAAAACEPTPQEVTVIQPAPPGVEPTSVTLDAANVAALVISTNNAAIQRAQVARTRATSPQVRAFAEQSLADHQMASQVIAQHLAEMDITPKPEATSAQIDANAATTVAMMQQATGYEVDRIYLESEIANRRWVIQTIDSAVLPMVPGGDARRSIQDLRELMVTRLMEAERLYETTLTTSRVHRNNGYPNGMNNYHNGTGSYHNGTGSYQNGTSR
ncbi:MAG TPA: DUF4142 domain-containing protein [Longimicrobiales bacterium]|nr:DUF4142 domain-containing protein [Longimicrobiales bacterium]